MASLPSFEISVQSSQWAVREALRKLLKALEPFNLQAEETGTVELVLAEALNNIVEHAYPDKASAGQISIFCARQDNGLHFRIVDQGYEMPEGTAALGMRPSLEVDINDLPEGGFGWPLIHDLAKDIEYQRVGMENHLSMRLVIEQADHSEG